VKKREDGRLHEEKDDRGSTRHMNKEDSISRKKDMNS